MLWRKSAWMICLILCPGCVYGQVVPISDTGRLPYWVTRYGQQESLFQVQFTELAEYTLSASISSLINAPEKNNKGQFLLQHCLKFTGSVEKPGRLIVTNHFIHRLGIQYMFDSITTIQQDENIFRTRIELTLPRDLGLAFDSELSTRLFNGYDYAKGSGGQTTRILNSSFLTPLIWNLSLGVSWKIPETGSVMAGISGAKLTFLRDTSVFSIQQTSDFQGVSRGHRSLFEYGFSCRILIERTFWKMLRWNCNLHLFKAFDKPADLNLKNQFELRPVKFLVISLQTNLLYEQDISRKLQVGNILSAGFMFRK